MSGEGRVFKVVIFGETYSLRSDDPPDHVQKVAQYVDGEYYEVAKESPSYDLAKIGILASLNIADELFRQEVGYREADAAAAAKVDELLEVLETGLGGRCPESPGEAGGSGVAGDGAP